MSVVDATCRASTDMPCPVAPACASTATTPVDTSNIVVCDGSVYDPSKPYLFTTLGNHTVYALEDQTEELGFDATSNRLIATLSLHDRCGVIVAPQKHTTGLQTLGYPVVAWGQTVAFPMCPKAIKAMGVGGAYPGSVVVHTFTEPLSLHNKLHRDTKKITGDGTFDGLNHLAGAYIPLALALQCATAGDTHVNLETKNSGVNLQKHCIDLVVGGNFSSLCFKDNTAGSIAVDGQITHCAHSVSNDMPLVVGKRQLLPGFDQLVQEMSGSSTSFGKGLADKVGTSIGKGVFENYDKQLETDIRQFASNRSQLVANGVSDQVTANPSPTIDMYDLSPLLQTSFCTTSMVAMEQPSPIGAPTVVLPTTTGTAATAAAASLTEADKYGSKFSTISYALEPHHNLKPGGSVNKFLGVVTVSHALFLSQTSTQEAYDICAPYADSKSPFLDCADPSCECNTKTQSTSNVLHTPRVQTTTALSTGFERMLLGVSQNIALSTTSKTALDTTKPTPKVSSTNTKVKQKASQCKATTSFCGTCNCTDCVNNSKLLQLAQLITSCTHAFQKCDNYVPDQTMCAVDAKGVPRYKATESMLPTFTALKAIMMKVGATDTDDVEVRVGMNSDDCENSAFESKAVLDTLRAGADCVCGDYFHRGQCSQAYNPAHDEEILRCMRLGNLSMKEKRHILLIAQVVGTKVQANLAYFVTGAASQANDMKHTDTDAHRRSDSGTLRSSVNNAMAVTLPVTVGSGLNAFGCKPPGQRVSHHMTTTGAGGTGLSGHCTCTLSILRSDGFLHSTVVEGTAHVRMSTGDIPCEVRHRGLLVKAVNDDEKVKGTIGYCGGPITMDNAIDVCVKGLLSSHVANISTRLQVPGSNMRPCMFMGVSEHVTGNCDLFYKKIVSTGPYQCVQLNDNNGVQPGADFKKFLKQRVMPIISTEVASRGESAVVKAMGNAMCAMVQVIDTKTPEYKKYEDDAYLFRRTMSPLRLSPAEQDRHMLSSLGSLASLLVNFPDNARLMSEYKMSTFTCFVTHVATDDTVEGRNKVLNSIENHVRRMNSEYVNVRLAKPVITGGGEIVTLYRIYGVPPGNFT